MSQNRPFSQHWIRLSRHLFLPLISLGLLGLSAPVQGQVDANINRAVWKQKFNVLDAQLNEQPVDKTNPYAHSSPPN